MNFKERFLEMERQFAKECNREAKENVEDLLITFIFKFQIFEPCKYVSEDDEYLTFILKPGSEIFESQIMTVRKDEIVSFGILDENEMAAIDEFMKEIEPETLYQ